MPSVSCVMVEPCLGTRKRFFFARSTPFWIASGTSLALPYPTPTIPFSSPTTTSAVNEKRRPPLTTLATRLISTTRSWRSRPAAEMDRSGAAIGTLEGSELDAEAAFAGAVGECLDAAVVAVAPTVEDRPLDAGGLRALREQLAGPARLVHRL